MADEIKGILKGKYSDGHAVLVDGVWYEVEKNVQGFVKTIDKDSAVSFKMREDGKKRYITYITVEGGKGETKKSTDMDGTKGTSTKPKTGAYTGKSDRTNEYWDNKDQVLNRQGALRSACIAVRALGEVSDVDTLESIVITLAKKFVNYLAG